MRLDDVTFKYDGGEKNILEQAAAYAVAWVPLVAIVGANGVGKTTLMKNIGEIEPQSGTIWKHHNLRIAYVCSTACTI